MKKCCREEAVTASVKAKVNGKAVAMNPFVQDIVGRAVAGMFSSLKGVKAPKSISLKVRLG
ncbi:MAG: hypothetical protein WC943_05995 [Elusimicrobiota bacterium]|jgi:hypothetical protein